MKFGLQIITDCCPYQSFMPSSSTWNDLIKTILINFQFFPQTNHQNLLHKLDFHSCHTRYFAILINLSLVKISKIKLNPIICQVQPSHRPSHVLEAKHFLYNEYLQRLYRGEKKHLFRKRSKKMTYTPIIRLSLSDNFFSPLLEQKNIKIDDLLFHQRHFTRHCSIRRTDNTELNDTLHWINILSYKGCFGLLSWMKQRAFHRKIAFSLT